MENGYPPNLLRLGKGYSRPNLNNMRKFYLRYPDYHLVSDKLSWSHICELIKIALCQAG